MKIEIGLWGRIVYAISSFCIRILARLLFKLKVVGIENIPKGQTGVIIACNHVSYLDPPLVHVSSQVYRTVHCMANKKLFRCRFLHWFMETVGTIPVNQIYSRKSLADVIRILRHSHSVIVFPEGTRSKNGRLIEGKAGLVHAAIHTDCYIVPTAIIGSNKVFSHGKKYIRLPRIEIHFGKPYKIYYWGNRKKIPDNILLEQTAFVMKKIESLLPIDMHSTLEERQKWYKKYAY